MSRVTLALLLSFLGLAISPTIKAQTLEPGYSFNFIGNSYSSATTAVRQPDGKILVFGSSGIINDHLSPYVYRLNPDLSVDESFSFDPDAFNRYDWTTQDAVVFQSNGKIVVATEKLRSSTVTNLYRLNPDGSLDETFLSGVGFNDRPKAIQVDAEDRLIVFGIFTNYNGTPVPGIVRLLPDGEIDSSFDPGLGISSQYPTGNLIVDDNGKIVLAASDFYSYNGEDVYSIARIDESGTLDPTFDPPDSVSAAMVLKADDGKYIVIEPDGTAIKLNQNGSVDESFHSPGPILGLAYAAALQDDGKIVIGDLVGGGIKRLHEDGSLDDSFSAPSTESAFIYGLTVSDGKVFCGCSTEGLIVLNDDGSELESSLHHERIVGITGIIEGSNDDKIVGGYFNEVNGSERKSVISINDNGTVSPTLDFYALSHVNIFGPVNNNKFYVAGYELDGYLARVNENGSRDNSFNAAFHGSGSISDLHQLPDGKIIIAGQFIYDNSSGPKNVARLNANGSIDVTFVPAETYDYVVSAALQPDNKIVLATRDYSVNPMVTHLLRFNEDGSLDASFNATVPSNFYGNLDISIHPEGGIFVIGSFEEISGKHSPGIIKLKSDGTPDPTFDAGTGASSISAIWLREDGTMYIGGDFSEYNGISRNRLARLNADGSIDETFNVNTGIIDGGISTLLVTGDELFAGGTFIQSFAPIKNGLLKITGVALPEEPEEPVTSLSTLLESRVTLHPNPFDATLSVDIENNYQGPLTATVYDATGRRLWQQESNKEQTSLRIACPTEKFNRGVYNLVIESSVFRESHRIVKK